MPRRASRGLAFLAEERPVEALEHLDVAVRVVPLRSWFSLAAAFLSLGSLAAFAFLYQVPLKVDGKGILLYKRQGGTDPLLLVTAPASGRLSSVAVVIGSKVRKGETLAEIDQKELADQVALADADLKRLQLEDATMSLFDQGESTSQANAQREVELALQRELELDGIRLKSQQRIAEGDQSLRLRGMLSQVEALKSKAETDLLDSKIASNRARVLDHVYTRLREETARRREALRRKLAVAAAETRLELLRNQLERDSQILSPYEGRVVDLMITPLGAVERGTAAVLLQPASSDRGTLEAIIFVPAGTGKKIWPGDAVEVSPDTIRRQEHGFIRGEIRSVSEIPCTEQAMLVELKHPALVSSLVEKYRGQVLLNIHVDLREARTSPQNGNRTILNRLDWSSSSGREQFVDGGTPCSTWIVVERRPLIALAMPWIRGLIGYN